MTSFHSSAVKDCDYVIHMASPFPAAAPKTEDEVITPAVEGTKNVLEACAKSGSVKRVVLTSSLVAIYSMLLFLLLIYIIITIMVYSHILEFIQ